MEYYQIPTNEMHKPGNREALCRIALWNHRHGKRCTSYRVSEHGKCYGMSGGCSLSEFNARLPVVLHDLTFSTTLLTLGISSSDYAQRNVSTETVIFRPSAITEIQTNGSYLNLYHWV
jgi:hypothetical protein